MTDPLSLFFPTTTAYNNPEFSFNEEIRDLPRAWNPYRYDPTLPDSIWNDPLREGKQIPTYHCKYCKCEAEPGSDHLYQCHKDIYGEGVCINCSMVYCLCCDKSRERNMDLLPSKEEFIRTRNLGQTTDVCLVCKHQVFKELDQTTNVDALTRLMFNFLAPDTTEQSFFIDKLFTNPNHSFNHATSSIDQETQSQPIDETPNKKEEE
jgi:hypothetical protein